MYPIRNQNNLGKTHTKCKIKHYDSMRVKESVLILSHFYKTSTQIKGKTKRVYGWDTWSTKPSSCTPKKPFYQILKVLETNAYKIYNE